MTIVMSLIVMQFLALPLPAGDAERGRADGNESFDTATEITTDGSPYSDSVNFDTDVIDILKFDLQPSQGECINTTVVINASMPDTFLYVMFFTPDKVNFAWNVAFGGLIELNYSFWAAVPGYYYLRVATENITDVNYNVTVTTNAVVHTPDGDNSLSEAPEVTSGNSYGGRVNHTTDPYDLFKVQVNSNGTHGDGLYVHLDNFTDVALTVYDPLGRDRAYSNTLGSSDPNKGETVRLVVNQTGFYCIAVNYELLWSENDHAYYELTLNKTPGIPHDEDWSMEMATETTLGIHEGRFDSSFDEYDYYSIDLEAGDELNVSVMAPDIEGWDMDIDIESWDLLDFDTDSGGSTQYRRTGCKIPEDGTYYIGIQNEEFGISNYTFLITIDGMHFGNTRPVTLNQTSDDLALVEDTSDTYDLNDVFNTKGPRTFSSPSHDTRNGMNLTVNITQAGIATVTPAGNWSGNETVTFRCRDYFNRTVEFTLNVSVASVNDVPFFADIAGTPMPALFWVYAVENEWSNFTANVTDADNSTEELNVSVTSGSSNLFYDQEDGLFHYYTDNDSVESETFTVTVSDGIGSTTQDINIDITGVNDPPVAKPIRLVSGGNGSLSVTLATDPAYDEEGDALSYLWTFGDGDNMLDTDLHTVSHTYDTSGYYLVQLVVDDSELNDTVSLEIAVTMGDAPDEPQWFSYLDDAPVGTNTSLEINITSAAVRDVEVAESFWTSTIDSTYDITGTCGDDVDVIYLYYGTEQLSYIRWKPVHEDKAVITPTDGTWSLNVTVQTNLTLFSGVDWMGILAMGWGDEEYNVDTKDAEYTFVELEDGGGNGGENIDPSLWKNLTKSYTDKNKDDLYQVMELQSSGMAKLESGKYGKRPEIDIVKLNSSINGSSLHIELTFRGTPVKEKELDLEKMDDFFESYDYMVYFVNPSYNEDSYSARDFGDSGPGMNEPSALFAIILEYPAPPSYFSSPDYTAFIEGNTIYWDVPLEYLADKGLEPSTDFGLFAKAEYGNLEAEPTMMYSGYDSAGSGAYSPDTSDDYSALDTGKIVSWLKTGGYVCGGIIAVVIIGVVVIVLVVLSKRKKKGPKKDAAPEVQMPVEEELSPEERTRKLIGEAESLGIEVSGFRDDMDRALAYLKEDQVQLKGSLDNICLRLQMEIDRKKGVQPSTPADVPPVPQESDAAGDGAGETEGGIDWAEQQPSGEFQAPVQQQSTEFQAPVCPTCGQVSVYYPEYECYWCDACQGYVYPEEPQTASPEVSGVQPAPVAQEAAAVQWGSGGSTAEEDGRSDLDDAFDF